MSNQLNQPLKFKTYIYDLDGAIVTDVTPDVTVHNPAGSLVATDTGTLVGDHYEYELDDALVTTYGAYTATFVVEGDYVPLQQGVIEVVTEWATRLDQTVGSRLAGAAYIAPPSVSDALTSYGVAKTSELMDASDVQGALDAQGYTQERSQNLDNLDAAISSLPAPLDNTETIAAVRTGLTNQGYTTTRAGFLDILETLVHDIWDYTNRSFTSFATAVTLNLRQMLPGIPQVNANLMHLVYGDTYDFDDGRSLGWEFSASQCPLLVSDDVPRLKFVDSTGATVMNITGTVIEGTRQVFFEPTSANLTIGDNTEDLSLKFQVSITRSNGHVLTPIPSSKGTVVLYRKAT